MGGQGGRFYGGAAKERTGNPGENPVSLEVPLAGGFLWLSRLSSTHRGPVIWDGN